VAGFHDTEETMSGSASNSRRIKRFYTDVSCEASPQGCELLLDGRRANTRAGHRLTAPTAALGEAIAAEWMAQQEYIDFAAMPLTRLLMTAIDLCDRDRDSWLEIILAHLSSDLLCYRAPEPAALVDRQESAWGPLLEWASTELGIDLITTIGVGHIDQPGAAFSAAGELMEAISDAELLAVKTAAEASGSAIIAFALWRDAQAADALFAASRVDEDFQTERWGVDAAAGARASAISEEFAAVGRFLRLLSDRQSVS
jgi:chaperone required for assembly of F1-ATPase